MEYLEVKMNYRLSSRAIIIKDNLLLLNEFNYGDYYNFPGGGLEDDETLRENATREVLEETGYTVETKELILLNEYNSSKANFKYGKRNSLSYFFRCEINNEYKQKERTVIDINHEDDKIKSTGYKWIAIDQLDKIKLIPDIIDVIIGVSKGEYYTRFIEEK